MIRLGRTLGITLVFLLVLMGGMGSAQTESYKIGPNDVLTLVIYAGGEKQYEGDLTVSSQGTINAPFIGTIKAAGFTPSDLEMRIAQPLARDYFVDPKVNISIKDYRSLHYYISGAVKKPGLYNSNSPSSLLELIAKAEGVLPDRGNVAYIMRDADGGVAADNNENPDARRKPITVDLKKLLDLGELDADPLLKPGDVVYIPLKESLNLAVSKIYVEGEVKKPGIYDYQDGMTALNAVILAGGFGQYAAPNRTRIIRTKDDVVEIIKINLKDVKDGKIADIELKPGDRITVPETWI